MALESKLEKNKKVKATIPNMQVTRGVKIRARSRPETTQGTIKHANAMQNAAHHKKKPVRKLKGSNASSLQGRPPTVTQWHNTGNVRKPTKGNTIRKHPFSHPLKKSTETMVKKRVGNRALSHVNPMHGQSVRSHMKDAINSMQLALALIDK